MNLTSFDQIVKNAPCRVCFEGFESNTLRLQNSGWDLSLEQFVDHTRLFFRLVGKNRHTDLYFYADSELTSGGRYRVNTPLGQLSPEGIVFHVRCVKTDPRAIQFNVHKKPQFIAMDATPYLTDFVADEYCSLDEVAVFKTFVGSDESTENIVIAPENALEALKLVRKLQDPKQAEIREKRLKEKRKQEFYKDDSKVISQLLVA